MTHSQALIRRGATYLRVPSRARRPTWHVRPPSTQVETWRGVSMFKLGLNKSKGTVASSVWIVMSGWQQSSISWPRRHPWRLLVQRGVQRAALTLSKGSGLTTHATRSTSFEQSNNDLLF